MQYVGLHQENRLLLEKILVNHILSATKEKILVFYTSVVCLLQDEKMLIENGFEEGENFINRTMFLSDEYAIHHYLDIAYSLKGVRFSQQHGGM